MNQAALKERVFELTAKHRLLVLDIPDSRRIVHGKGYPDLTIVGPNGIIFAELKSEDDDLSRDQLVWKYALIAAGAWWRLWRPVDLAVGTIDKELRRIA